MNFNNKKEINRKKKKEVKVKKIKLDKLKNKLKINNLNSYKADNININLNLNNRIININNNQKIYAPKKAPIPKLQSLDISNIPLNYSFNRNYKNNLNRPYILSQNEDESSSI